MDTEIFVVDLCQQSIGQVTTFDNVTFPSSPTSCWSLVSGNCDPEPGFAVFTKSRNNLLAMRAYIGGHRLEFLPNSSSRVEITKDGSVVTLNNKEAKIFKVEKQVIFT